MKLGKILKFALSAVLFGSVMGSINAAQRVTVHNDFKGKSTRELEMTASHYKHLAEKPEDFYPRLAHTDALEVFNAFKAGNLDTFARHYAVAAGDAIEHYIKTNLMVADAAFLRAASANLANAAAEANVYALVTDAGGAPAGGAAYVATGGWGVGGFAENEMPADLTRDAFIAALKNRMRQVTPAHLHTLHAFAMPAQFDSVSIQATKDAIRDAVKADIRAWLTLMDTTGGGNMVKAAVPNAAAGVALVAPNLTAAGADGPGMFADAGGRVAPQPANRQAAEIANAFDTVIDFVNKF